MFSGVAGSWRELFFHLFGGRKGVWKLFWALEAVRLDFGGFETGKSEAGGCQGQPRV